MSRGEQEAAEAVVAQVYGFYMAMKNGEIVIDKHVQNHDIVTLTLDSGCEIVFAQAYFERRRREKRNQR